MSIEYNSPIDEVNFSFESVASDLETTLNTTKKSLARKLFDKKLQNSTNPASEIDAVNESISFSFPSEENQSRSYKPAMPLNSIEISKELDKNELLNDRNTSDQTPNGDSIEISDDEFEYSINLSNNNLAKGPKDKLLNEDSIEISDDEINYSMSHESPRTQPRHHKYPHLLQSDEPIFNESLQQIFDDNFDPPVELHLQVNNKPTEDIDLIDQSVRSIVRKDFVSNTKPRTSGSTSGTPLRRTTSAMLGHVPNQPPTKFLSRLDETIVKDFSMNYDSFDDLLQGLNLPDNARQLEKSPPPKEDEHTFTVIHDGSTFEVKIGQRCVSPKPNFESMDSPTISRQLIKYGLKPLVRRKAIICLEHIYNRMHPFVDCPNEESSLSRSDFDAQLQHEELEVSTELPSNADVSGASTSNSLTLYTTKNSTTKSLPSDFFVYFMNFQTEYYLPSPPRAKVITNKTYVCYMFLNLNIFAETLVLTTTPHCLV